MIQNSLNKKFLDKFWETALNNTIISTLLLTTQHKMCFNCFKAKGNEDEDGTFGENVWKIEGNKRHLSRILSSSEASSSEFIFDEVKRTV